MAFSKTNTPRRLPDIQLPARLYVSAPDRNELGLNERAQPLLHCKNN
jgi:hypothetical protein